MIERRKRPKDLRRLPVAQANGRPTVYHAGSCNHVARKACEMGATDREVAELLGISLKCLYEWKIRHPSFAAAMRLGKEIPDARVERSLYGRAVGYDYEEDQFFIGKDGKPDTRKVMRHAVPDVNAQKHWMRHRDPDRWGGREQAEDQDVGTASLQNAQDQLVAKVIGIAARMCAPRPRVIEGRASEAPEGAKS